ncbi:MAG: hypothetical protein L0Y56_18040, partial [Nitrospira sp.]|nr:hypothetical protein [Nitrospira sp.]
MTAGNCSQPGITVSGLKALHLHRYTNDPSDPIFGSSTPLDFVATDAAIIRAGVDWYRGAHGGGGTLDVDVLLSEMGYLWSIISPLRWAGGWSSFRLGLSWWNSYLSWLTRRASYECNLQGWSTGAHALHACIHVP